MKDRINSNDTLIENNKEKRNSKTTTPRNGELHKNHRKRIDRKIEKHGFETLPDHEQLEAILFVAIPRGDTNELAHQLLNRFGTFQGVLNAGYKKLLEVKGVGYRTAMFLSQLNGVAGVILRNQQEGIHTLDTSEKIRGYISTYYLGRLREASYIFFLDANNRLRSTEKLSEGTIDQTHIYPREVAKCALENSASSVIIAHNHPSGIIEPSPQDINITKALEAALSAVGVRLYDSVIISDNSYFSFRDNGYLIKVRWIN